MTEKYVKSPLNYTGGKYKLLTQILPLFPNDIETFVDLFGGGFNVGVNVNAKNIIYNDINVPVVPLMNYLYGTEVDVALDQIDRIIAYFNLSKENVEGFNQLRTYYNTKNKSPILFYVLICYAFNYQIRFNKNGDYNMPFGKNRSSFNASLKRKFIEFVHALHDKRINFISKPFTSFDIDTLHQNDLVYCDPPYLNSIATYNEQSGWTNENEKELLLLLDTLNNKGIRFALSNNLKYENQILDTWKNKYKIHYLNSNYSNCSYHKIDKSKDIEVLITNY